MTGLMNQAVPVARNTTGTPPVDSGQVYDGVGSGVGSGGYFTQAVTGLLCFAVVGTATVCAVQVDQDRGFVSFARRGTGLVLDPGATVHIPAPAPAEFAEDAAVAATVTDADSVKWLHEASGLTWDQLGKVFGVSRRAVHLWANGGRLNSANAAKLAEFVGLVREMRARRPEDRRAQLLAPARDGRNLLDRMRYRDHDSDISGSPWSPAELLRAEPNRPPSTT